MKALVFAAALVACSNALARQNPVQVKLQSIYDHGEALALKKDIGGLAKFMTETRGPNFLLESKSGKHKLPEILKSMTSVLTAFDRVTHATAHIDKIKVDGATAIATVNIKFELATKPMQDRKIHFITEESIDEDTWSLNQGVWKLSHSKIVKQTFLRDHQSNRS